MSKIKDKILKCIAQHNPEQCKRDEYRNNRDREHPDAVPYPFGGDMVPPDDKVKQD